MKTIPLTQGQVALVDDEDYEYLNQWKWYALQGPNTFYAVRAVPSSLPSKGRQSSISMHREIMHAPIELEVDHRNGDGLYNLRENLRLCTRSENMQNQGISSKNTSGYKGVSWHKHHKTWCARIMINRKSVHLGYFNDPIDAALAYDVAALELHGDFARTNFKTQEKI